jgi:hypothetical protein
MAKKNAESTEVPSTLGISPVRKGDEEEGWGDENLVNKLKRKIAELEDQLENCGGPDFSNVSNRFHDIPGREI